MVQTETQKELSGSIKALFEIQQGNDRVSLLIRKERVVIGSIESADIKLKGEQIAPIHAFLEITWGPSLESCQARIVDLASPTGVAINGKKVVNEIIRSGDEIVIGSARLKFSFKRPDLKPALANQALLLINENEIMPIFDYRPPVKEALETVYSWNGIILDLDHYLQALDVPGLFKEYITNDFAVRKSNSEWMLSLHDRMTGTLYIDGKIISLKDYGQSSVVLKSNDFAKVNVGHLSFYVSQTLAPPTIKKHAKVITDPFLAKTLFTSLAVTCLMLFGVSQMEMAPLEAVPETETIATILYHPEKYSVKGPPVEPRKEKEKTPPEPEKKRAEVDFTKPKEKEGKVATTQSSQPGKRKSAQSQSKEGQGARAKGQEGSRGSKTANVGKNQQTQASRTSPEPGKSRGGTVSQSPDHGNVQMLKGATNKILDLLGGSGQKLGASGSKLQGFGGFSTQGNGGLALSGQGKGGGGNADTLLGGTSDRGRGGGRVGTGLGAEGTGSGIVGGKTRVELNLGGGEETVVVGAIDRDAIDAAIRAHRDEFRYCYEREVNAGHPNLAGKVLTVFVIGGSGRASQTAIGSSSMGSPAAERCVLNVISRIQFPLPTGGVPVNIKYPFNFANTSK